MPDLSERSLRAFARNAPSAAAFGRRIRSKGEHMADSEVRERWKAANPFLVYTGDVPVPEGISTPHSSDGKVHVQFKSRKRLTPAQAQKRGQRILRNYKSAYGAGFTRGPGGKFVAGLPAITFREPRRAK